MVASAALEKWAAACDVVLDGTGEQGGKRWTARAEFYVTDPETVPDPAQWQTVIEYKLSD